MGRPQTLETTPLVERRRARQRAYYYKRKAEAAANAPEPTAKDLEQAVIKAAEYRLAQRLANQASRQQRRSEKAKMHRRWLNRLKTERGCIDCGYNDWPSALHFDHRPDEVKSFDISKKLHIRWDRLLEEISKCDVRCANCHHKVTDLRRWGVPHGH